MNRLSVRPNLSRSLNLALVVACLLGACASPPPSPPQPPPPEPRRLQTSGTTGLLIARDAEFAVVIAESGDTFASLAQHYLGDARRAWWIATFNRADEAAPGQQLVIPLKPVNPVGVYPNGYQTVPILCYHRFSSKRSKLAVTPTAFAEQMEYLARNGYRVLSIAQLQGFLKGTEPIPSQAVVITIDDGYRSVFEIAFPILKKYEIPATVFLYSDFIGAADALTWPQIQEMLRSGLIEVQPHSKTHDNLASRSPQETDAQYRARIFGEVDIPSKMIEDRLSTSVYAYAYPYGDRNAVVIDQLARRGIALGLTATPGGNAFFANPYLLRRTMIFGDDDIATFAEKLAIFTKVELR
jgi:peptidoglycan/xylan/chitin deacetylase (PgdA/CDA1 family)